MLVRLKLTNQPTLLLFIDKPRPKAAPVRTATKMEKSQSENPATEFAQFADQEDREKTGANRPLTEKHAGIDQCTCTHV